MKITVNSDGSIQCLYTEALNLPKLGHMEIKRASHVEPTSNGQWTADLSPSGGPILGPYAKRSQALSAEREWLEDNAL